LKKKKTKNKQIMDQKTHKISPPTTSSMNLSTKLCTILILINIINVKCDVDYKFKSVPTTIKTFENDSVLLPCNHESKFNKKLLLTY
jgi:hypothetical protein